MEGEASRFRRVFLLDECPSQDFCPSKTTKAATDFDVAAFLEEEEARLEV